MNGRIDNMTSTHFDHLRTPHILASYRRSDWSQSTDLRDRTSRLGSVHHTRSRGCSWRDEERRLRIRLDSRGRWHRNCLCLMISQGPSRWVLRGVLLYLKAFLFFWFEFVTASGRFVVLKSFRFSEIFIRTECLSRLSVVRHRPQFYWKWDVFFTRISILWNI